MALTQVDQGMLGTNAQYTGFKNRLINSAMVIDQRNAGASVTVTGNPYTLDRWYSAASVDGKYTVQQNAGSVTPPAGFTNYLGCTVGASANVTVGAGDYFGIRQAIEGYNVSDFGFGSATASTVTLSFWVRSSVTGTYGATLKNSANNRSYPFTYAISAANTWEQKSVTVAGDTTGTWLTTNGVGLYITFGLGVGSTYSGTAGAWAASNLWSATGAVKLIETNSATFYITGVQLEKGSTATSFDYRPYGTELALCQRYCMAWRVDGAAQQYIAVGQAYTTAIAIFTIPQPVTPRVTPTGIVTSATSGFGSLTTTAGGSTGSSIVINSSSNMALTLIYTATGAFTTAGAATALYFNGTTGAYIYTSGSEL